VRSRVYRGTVRHRRSVPVTYDFRYGVYYLGLDLDEIAEVDARLRLLSVDRRNLYELRRGDHYGDAGLAASMRERLAARGHPTDDWRIELVTYPRVAGFVFNPVSFYLCRDRASDAIRHVVAEVHNTHRDRHLYDLDAEPGAAPVYRSHTEKRFYVSPFIDMDARYDFRLAETSHNGASRLSLAINAENEDDGQFLHTGLQLQAGPLSDGALARAFVAMPFLTVRTIGLIHWHALKLWRRGLSFRPYGRPGAAP